MKEMNIEQLIEKLENTKEAMNEIINPTYGTIIARNIEETINFYKNL